MHQPQHPAPAQSSVERVRAALATHGLDHLTVREFAESTATAAAAASAIGTTVGRIVKSLVFMAGEHPVRVLASAPNRGDIAQLCQPLRQPPQPSTPSHAPAPPHSSL